MPKVTDAFWQADPIYVALAVLLYVAAILTNTFKWGILLRAQGVEAPWSVLVRFTFVGLFFNNLLPAAVGGDLMKGYELTRYTRRGADAAVPMTLGGADRFGRSSCSSHSSAVPRGTTLCALP